MAFRDVRATLLAAAGGLIVGAWVGSSLVRVYDWTSEWTLDAPRDDVYRVMTTEDTEQRWWPSMVVERIVPIAGSSGYSVVTYRVLQAPNVRRLAPPFRIHVATTDTERGRRTRAAVTGDLAGVLETLYFDRPDGGTRVVFYWYVRVTNPLLNAVGYFIEPIYRASHDHVMREGESGLQSLLRERLEGRPTRSARHESWPMREG